MRGIFFNLCVLILVSALTAPTDIESASFWKGQILDAETGKPLEGVVVLVYWLRFQPSLGGWAGGEFVDSDEVVTGADGRFTVRLRRSYTIPLVTKVSGPEIVIFKPGYGQWRYRRAPDEIGKSEEVVIELPLLKTREERLRFYQSPGRTPSALVPRERIKRFLEVEDAERTYLGFR